MTLETENYKNMTPANAEAVEKLLRDVMELEKKKAELYEQLLNWCMAVRGSGYNAIEMAAMGWDDNLMPQGYWMSTGTRNPRLYEDFPMRYNYVKLNNGTKVSLVEKLLVKRVYLPLPIGGKTGLYNVVKNGHTSDPIFQNGEIEFDHETAKQIAHALNVELLQQKE